MLLAFWTLTVSNGLLWHLVHLLSFWAGSAFFGLSGVYVIMISRKRKKRQLWRQNLPQELDSRLRPNAKSCDTPLPKKPEQELLPTIISGTILSRFATRCRTITGSATSLVRGSAKGHQGTTDKRSDGVGSWSPLIFSAAVCGFLLTMLGLFIPPRPVLVLSCPDDCLGVEKVEGPNEIAVVNLKTGRPREFKFRADPPITPHALFAGYVIELSFIEKSGYEIPPPDGQLFHIVRGKELTKHAYSFLLGSHTTPAIVDYDGEDRPVLAHNCHNTSDDQSTVCDGEPFTEQNAKSSRSLWLH